MGQQGAIQARRLRGRPAWLLDNTRIPAASLLCVLDGVIVATKASSAIASALKDIFGRHEIVHGPESPAKIKPRCTTLKGWLKYLSPGPLLTIPGLREAGQITLAISLLRERARADLEISPATLDQIWKLINDAILSNSSHGLLTISPTRSAQGFMSIALCSLISNGRIDELWRFHVWLPDHQRGVAEVAIHAHQPYAQSWVLAGCGLDFSYEGQDVDDPLCATHAAYDCQWRGNDVAKSSLPGYQTHQTSSTARRTERLVRVNATQQKCHSRNMSYSVPAGAYHRSAVPGDQFHATLFVFDANRGYDENAAVLGPMNGEEYTQLRDPGALTAQGLASMTNAMREWESTHDQDPDAPGHIATASQNYATLMSTF